MYSANIVVPRDASPEILAADALSIPIAAARRALPNSPSGGYAPAAVACPANRPTIRKANSLSANETSWLETRRNATIEPMISWLTRMNISDFDAAAYINGIKDNATALPNIGMAVSGGGYRALMNGAGFIAASDDRTQNATNTGQIGGLLQVGANGESSGPPTDMSEIGYDLPCWTEWWWMARWLNLQQQFQHHREPSRWLIRL